MAKRITITPEEFAEKHARRLKAAIPDIQAGIERVTESPTAKAAAKQDKMLNNLTKAVTSGKWGAGLRRVTVDDWKHKFLSKGVARIPDGIDAAHDKVVGFAQQLLPYETALQGKIAAMPDLTVEDSVARSSMWIREMFKFVRK
ncbi:MAG: hypothetical protein AB1744_00955 [Candidatus Zixiibacteriota bacterium]